MSKFSLYVGVLVVALTCSTLLAGVPAPADAAPKVKVARVSSSTPLPRVGIPAAGSAYFGAFTPGGPYDPAAMDAFASDAGRRPRVDMWYQAWGSSSAFDPTAMNTVAGRGGIPMVTWEPWNPADGTQQPAFSLADIAGGNYDNYVTAWARAAKAWGHPMFLRFGQEMNQPYYPWSVGVDGNTAASYVAAWRHIHAIFATVGATNVSWVWSPTLDYSGTTPLAQLWPGAGYVDWLGVDGYNGGTALPWGGWLTFDQLFAHTLQEFSSLAPGLPMMIAEMSSVEQGGSKSAWITDAFQSMSTYPELRAFVWFNQDKEADWRIESSITSQAAFAAGVANSRFLAG